MCMCVIKERTFVGKTNCLYSFCELQKRQLALTLNAHKHVPFIQSNNALLQDAILTQFPSALRNYHRRMLTRMLYLPFKHMFEFMCVHRQRQQ